MLNYWRAIRRWLFFTTVDALSCVLFVVHRVVYAKPACPISTVHVPPGRIEYSIEPTKFVRGKRYWFSGLIRRKDWEHLVPLQQKHRLLFEHFSALSSAASPEISDEDQSELDRYRLILESLSTRGFAIPTWLNRSVDPFCLSIGANGEFLFMTGKHRLALAKVAGVRTIPARISARHWKWQAYRDALYRRGRKEGLSAAELDAIEHPDLQDIVHTLRRFRAPGQSN